MRRAKLKTGLGLALSTLFLALALRNVEWPGVWSSWRAARMDLLVLGTGLLVGSWVVAAVRWRFLLRGGPGLRIQDTFAYITIGYLANTVLPLRLGDLARASLIGRRKNVGIGRALGSMGVERMMDVLMLVALTLVLTLVIEVPPAIRTGLAGMTAVALVVLGGLVAVSLNRERLPRLAGWLERIMPRRLADRFLTILGNISSGAEVLHRPSGLLGVVVLSAAVWLAAGMGTLAWVGAFRLAVPWYAGFFVLVVVNLGSAIPSSPGYVGVYHYLAMLALSLWTPDRNAALAYAIGTHALNMMANAGLGSYFLAREGLSLRRLREQMVSPENGTSRATSGGMRG
jgi:glycosyltransferase 2 family protein